MPSGDHLFAGGRGHRIDRAIEQKIVADVGGIKADDFLKSSEEDLVSHLVDKYWVSVPKLDRNGITVGSKETKIDVTHDMHYGFEDSGPIHVDGTRIEFSVPFDGDPELFTLTPSRFGLHTPRAAVSPPFLIFTRVVRSGEEDAHLTRVEFDKDLKLVETYLETHRKDFEAINSRLEETARSAISARREKLLAGRNLAASLGYNLRTSADAAKTYVATSVRRKIRPMPRPSGVEPFAPEPTLSDENYEHILKVIEDSVLMMERSPTAFATLGEEQLRDHLLVPLNGHFEGHATGETFNFSGKTDILIREQGKNIFIGECKFWKGPKGLRDTVDRLLGYSSWRDTKTSVILFNRDVAFSTVIDKMRVEIPKHRHYKRTIGNRSEPSTQYVFGQPLDTQREMLLTVMAFNVPTRT